MIVLNNLQGLFVKLLFLMVVITALNCQSLNDNKHRLAEDFNFYLDMDVCGREIIDTENYTLTRIATVKGDVKIRLPMSDEQIDTVQQIMDRINFYNYPPENLGDGSTNPHDYYTFIVKKGTQKKFLKYENSNFFNETDLDMLIRYIRRTLQSTQPYQSLPKYKDICL